MTEQSQNSLSARIKRISKITLDLAHVRMQIFSLEAAEQKQHLLQTIIYLILFSVCFLLGFITLLFGLNTVLSAEIRTIVFFGLFALFILIALICLVKTITTLKNQPPPFHNTLQEIQKDLNVFREMGIEEEKND